jgi:Transglycosylase SLT domain
MPIAPRTTRARRLGLEKGRARIMLLVAAASFAAGSALPAAAGSEPPDSCGGDPAAAVVPVDGQQAPCATTTDAQPDDPAGQPSTTTPPGPTAPVTAPPTGSDPAPAGGEPPQDPPPHPPSHDVGPQDPTPAAWDDPPAAVDAPPSPPHEAPPAGEQPAVEPQSPAPQPGERHGATREPARHPARPGVPPHRTDRERQTGGTHRPSRHHASDLRPAGVTTVSLPSAWTSLEPIVLPPFSVAEFPVPIHLLPLYQAAGAEYGVPWEVLAAINEVETRYGEDAHVSSAGAIGFMQFLRSTWADWGRDADGDRRRDPRNPVDAIFSAARYLHAAGADEDLGRAIFAYNHADWYVERVLTRARELAGLDPDQVAALTEEALDEHPDLYEVEGSPFFGPGVVDPTPGQALLMTTPQLTRRVLKDERIDLYACGRGDVEAGRIDRRVLATLLFLAESGFRLHVSSLECGHRLMTTSGNVSAHSYGAAVDIAAVDGTPIAGHQGPGSVTEQVLRRLVRLQGLMRPDQIISLMTIDGAANTLAMADHADHIHVGFARRAEFKEER